MSPIFTRCNNRIFNENARRIENWTKLQTNEKNILQMLLIQKNDVFAEGEVGNRIKHLPPREARVSNNTNFYYKKGFWSLLPKNKTNYECDRMKNVLFSDVSKNAERTLYHKKGNVKKKIIYQLIPYQIFSTVFERLIQNKPNEFIETNFSKFLTSFWTTKNYKKTRNCI